MAKVAVLGANGQVGAELCLLLARVPEIQLVPVCRYRRGSAFLRWNGIACRHGRITDPGEASRLVGDCDVVINSALAGGSPREMRSTENAIVAAIFTHARPGAVVIHFSTQSVYGDAAPLRMVRWQSQYGRAKLATERQVQRFAGRSGRAAFIFRLGHVCGSLQQISINIRDQILRGEVLLPLRDVASNTVYTATIRDAILHVMRGAAAPGTYDLMNAPQWTWKQVYEFEAAEAGVPFLSGRAAVPPPRSSARAVVQLARRGVAAIARNTWLREWAASSMGYLPERTSRRAQALWYMIRARAQIGALANECSPAEHLSWVANGERFLAGLPATRATLASRPYEGLASRHSANWPDDLPAAR
jgi:nucleoside-diphosphate-sugar epimerase